jgi:alpha-tubulin suppressor-like RCC1 family protein
LTTTGDLYSWGRGLYGVLGNAANTYALEPELNDELKSLRDDEPENK